MKRIWTRAVSLTLTLFVLAALPASATIRYDGTVPIYPNGIVQGEAGNPEFKAALRYGIQMFVDTSDAPSTVVRWYRAHLPASFSMHVESAGTQFASGDKVVNVVRYQGKTRIAISPG
jgi:hypothetical protein